MTLQWQTEFRPGVLKVVHVSACNVLRTRKLVFTSRSEPRFSLGLFLKVSAAQPPDRPPQRSAPKKRDSQAKRPCPSSFRGPLGLSSSGDSTRHQPARTVLLLHSALCLQPATCNHSTTSLRITHHHPLTLLSHQYLHTPVRQRKATKQHPPPPHIRPRGDTTPQP